MTLTADTRRELEELVDLFIARSITDAECARLNTILQDCEAAQLFYLDHMGMHAALTMHATAAPTSAVLLGLLQSTQADAFPHEDSKECSAATLGLASLPALKPTITPMFQSPEVLSNSSRSPVLGFLGGITYSLGRPVVWSILGVGVLLASYFVAISWDMLGRETGMRLLGRGDGSNSDLQPAASSLQNDAVATITASEDAQWSHDSELPPFNPRPRPGAKWSNPQSEASSSGAKWSDPKSAIAPDEPLSITSGLVELQLKQGATLLIEGPADWKINGANSATLTRGKLVAEVPREAVGFTLNTPNAKIVDLGTKFAVEVNAKGESGVDVVQGKVEVQHEGRPAQTLRKGESINVTREGVTATKQDLAKFSALLERGGTAVAPATMPDIDLKIDMTNQLRMNWSSIQAWDGELPQVARRYHVGRLSKQVLRSPESVQPEPFAGSELVIHSQGILALKHAGDAKIERLTLDGGKLFSLVVMPGKPEATINGLVSVPQEAEIRIVNDPLSIASRLEGVGNLNVFGPGRLTLCGDGRNYSGNWRVQDGLVVALTKDSLGKGNVSVEGKGVLDLRYRWNNPRARLSLAKGSSLALNFGAKLGEVLVDGQSLAAGMHTLKELKETYPGYFAGKDDSLTVEIVGPPEVAKPKA